jgi:RNase H-fold protein (predicted Holliday junction resolvase)
MKITGTTVQSLRKRYERITSVDRRLHQLFQTLHDRIDAAVVRTDERVKQAIADRQVAIRVMTDEITELTQL